MKHHVRTLTRVVALIAAIGVAGCGGKQTMASKSAAAFDAALKKGGIPAAQEAHGGHGQAANAERAHGASDSNDGAGMDHSKMPGMQHGSPGSGGHDRAAMGHAAMPGMDHSKMAGMQHGSSTTAPLVIAPPTTNAAIAQTQPAATLRADDFDAPAPAAIDEAKKTAQPPPEHHHGNGEAL